VVEKVGITEAEKSAIAVVADHQLSLAIGKKGQNVRLAAKLTGWKIDIISQSEYEKERVKDRDREINAAIAHEQTIREEQEARQAEAQAAAAKPAEGEAVESPSPEA
jgi:N utilization substance protein A